MKKIVLALSLFIATTSFAGFLSDIAINAGNSMQIQKLDGCVKTCTPGDGQCYSACNNIYGAKQSPQVPIDSSPQAPMKQTDFTCMNQCTSRGYMFGFCQNKCSY